MFQGTAEGFLESPGFIGAIGPGWVDYVGSMLLGDCAGVPLQYIAGGGQALYGVGWVGVCDRLAVIKGSGNAVDIAVLGVGYMVEGLPEGAVRGELARLHFGFREVGDLCEEVGTAVREPAQGTLQLFIIPGYFVEAKEDGCTLGMYFRYKEVRYGGPGYVGFGDQGFAVGAQPRQEAGYGFGHGCYGFGGA